MSRQLGNVTTNGPAQSIVDEHGDRFIAASGGGVSALNDKALRTAQERPNQSIKHLFAIAVLAGAAFGLIGRTVTSCAPQSQTAPATAAT